MSSKLYILFTGIIGISSLLLIVILDFFDKHNYSFCEYWPESGYPTFYCQSGAAALYSLVLLIPLAVALFFTRSNVIDAWVRFARWWLPLTMLIIFISPTEGGSS